MINANDLNNLRISLASSLPDWMIADGKLFGAFFAKTSRLYYTNSIKRDPKNSNKNFYPKKVTEAEQILQKTSD